MRAEMRGGVTPGAGLRRGACGALALLRLNRPSLRRVINATGVVLHTNLGRAPLPAWSAIPAYSNLEFDLATGRRGKRDVHAARLLERLLGGPAIAVNNNAAAVYLALHELAAGDEVVVSRGELIEIGDGFRIPDIMARSGAVVREVGTTNRTRIEDYRDAITDRTRLILRVHPSNFRIGGFTARPELRELVALGREKGVPVYEDLGSGCLVDLSGPRRRRAAGGRQPPGRGGPGVLQRRQAARRTAGRDHRRQARPGGTAAPQSDVPRLAPRQAHLPGAGDHAAADRARAVRPDSRAPDDLSSRGADPRARRAPARKARGRPSGTDPRGISRRRRLDPRAVAPHLADRRLGRRRAALERRLRSAEPPVVARIEKDRLLLDLRTVQPEEEEELLAALQALS